jgi:periplasmic copper chaperone A
MPRPIWLYAAVLAALFCAPAASAHVTVNPSQWEAGGFARFAIRVPTERPDAVTTRVQVKLPDGVFFVAFQPKAGWTRKVTMTKLREPVEVSGERIGERVDTVTWSGGRIRPGEFDEFGISARMPDSPGRELVFPAVQTYSSGEVVRWIGPPDAEEPAPRVKLTETAEGTATTPRPSPPIREGGDVGAVEIIALVLGAAGLAAGLVALIAGRRLRPGP